MVTYLMDLKIQFQLKHIINISVKIPTMSSLDCGSAGISELKRRVVWMSIKIERVNSLKWPEKYLYI